MVLLVKKKSKNQKSLYTLKQNNVKKKRKVGGEDYKRNTKKYICTCYPKVRKYQATRGKKYKESKINRGLGRKMYRYIFHSFVQIK